jgi:hypothetical protein
LDKSKQLLGEVGGVIPGTLERLRDQQKLGVVVHLAFVFVLKMSSDKGLVNLIDLTISAQNVSCRI